ncbi:TRAP transporter small permease [Pseudooceanicola sediminis]|uniref:TRAP transporter small permease protein n=1 Tax=Pseudooceanicola sediminis TaxID=2211117 RepID=A0A399IW38_9RHOB|nr:TRAP transporter small permease [Pseudooceanicola sediminis]KAA2314973.1 TRAP transporter small permease [Puniceibacterium sp. HSS470]RII37345.1 TRAP transporter small permease [Pseudooceanicola sediminis]|tara:strand:- start:6319 stop:6855 length:537 start_codon:yes stop_codon:yes gene_type:complete
MPSRHPERQPRRHPAILAPIVIGLNALGSIWIIGLMLLICSDILMRTLFNAPIAGVAEMVAFSIVGIVFLQLAHTLSTGALTRSDLVLDTLARRTPRLRGYVLAVYSLTGAVLLAIALWRFFPSLMQAWDRPERHFMGNPGFFQIPTWPLYALMVIGMAATIAQFAAGALAALTGEDG